MKNTFQSFVLPFFAVILMPFLAALWFSSGEKIWAGVCRTQSNEGEAMIPSFTFDQDDLIHLALEEVVRNLGGAFKPSNLKATVQFSGDSDNSEYHSDPLRMKIIVTAPPVVRKSLP